MSEPLPPFVLAVRASAEGVVLGIGHADGTDARQILLSADHAHLLAEALRKAEGMHRRLVAAPAVVGHA